MNLESLSFESIALFIHIAGFIIGLGAVTVIDWHGFLGRNSSYWTEATTRTHKVTKPLIWVGTLLAITGGVLWYAPGGWSSMRYWQTGIALALVLNGFFLTFGVSRFLLDREKKGKSSELLPAKWQRRITVSFLVSFLGWWSEVGMLVYALTS